MKMINSQYMKLAIDEAWKYQLLTYPNPAVGATIVKNNKVLSTEAHKESGTPHAEVLALKSAYLSVYPNSKLQQLESSHEIHNYLMSNHNNFFHECEIYVTLEPCNHIGKTPACSVLLEAVKIKKVYIGSLDPNDKASGGLERLQNADIDVVIDVCKDESDKLLFPFLQYQKKHFHFFKMAMRSDGSINNGYITTQDSLNLVHEIRTKIDLMVIGGNTIRIDRPTLDARFSANKKAPDIFIYSRQKEFDKSIPLFQIKKRDIMIGTNLDYVSTNSFVMYEGGYQFLNVLKDKIDYLMLFISCQVTETLPLDISKFGFEIQHSYYINEFDKIVYLKRVNGE